MTAALKNADAEQRVFSIKRTAAILDADEATVRRLCRSGELESFLMSNRRKVLVSSIDAYIERQRVAS